MTAIWQPPVPYNPAMASRSDPTRIAPLPARGYVFLALLFAVGAVIATSLAIYGANIRLGYSYAVHSAIFFPLERGNRVAFLVGLLASAALVWLVSRILRRRHSKRVKLVPWWCRIALLISLAVYVVQVLEINISFMPSD